MCALARPDGVDDADLASGLAGVCSDSRGRSASGPVGSRPQRVEDLGPVGDLGHRLRGDGADARLGPRDDPSGAEDGALHRDAELAGVGTAGHDRVRHGAGT